MIVVEERDRLARDARLVFHCLIRPSVRLGDAYQVAGETVVQTTQRRIATVQMHHHTPVTLVRVRKAGGRQTGGGDILKQLLDTRVPTQLGRTFGELGIGSVKARSPQAKGRIERLWGTLQDRLVAELRLAGVEDRDSANAYLARYLSRHNRRFMVPAADPEPAWRRLPAGTRLERVCCFKYRRTVARDGTVRAGATILQVPPKPNGRSRAGQRVELHVRLDGRLVVWDGQRHLMSTPAPLDAVQLRALHHARVEVGEMPRSASTATAPPSAAHPWRRVAPGTKLATTIKAERDGVTDSLNS